MLEEKRVYPELQCDFHAEKTIDMASFIRQLKEKSREQGRPVADEQRRPLYHKEWLRHQLEKWKPPHDRCAISLVLWD